MHCQILSLKRCKTLFICISSLAQMLLYRYCIGVRQQWMALCTSLLDPKLLVHCRIFFSLNLGGWQWLWNLTNTHTQSHTQRLSREAVGASRREMSAQCQGVSLARHGRACLWMFLNVTTLEASGANTHTHLDLKQREEQTERRGKSVLPRGSGHARGKWPTIKRISLLYKIISECHSVIIKNNAATWVIWVCMSRCDVCYWGYGDTWR